MAENEEIEYRLTLESRNFLNNLDASIQRVKDISNEMKMFAKVGKASLEEVARDMKKTFAEQKWAEVEMLPKLKAEKLERPKAPSTIGLGADDKASVQAAHRAQINAINEENKARVAAVKTANAEIAAINKATTAQATADIKQYNADVMVALKQINAQKKADAAETTKLEKTQKDLILAGIKEQEEAEKKLGQVMKDMDKQDLDRAEQQSKARGKVDKENALYQLANQKITFNPKDYPIVQGLEETRKQVDGLKTDIGSLSNVTGESFKLVGKELTDVAQKAGMTGEQFKQFKSNVSTAVQELSKGKGVFSNFITMLGRLGIVASAATIFRSLTTYLKEAARSAFVFSKAVYGLQIGVRALQRAGVEITIKDVTDNIAKLREEWGIFSQKELVEGTAQLINLVRSFGFTKDEIFGLQDAIATLAIVNGRAMDDVQRTVALAISSGYTEGLQRLGVSINRVTIAEKAAEMGWKGGYTALTEQQRAMATYVVILEKVALYADDAKNAQNEYFGSIQKSESKLKDITKEIGNVLLPVWAKLLEVLAQGAKMSWAGFRQGAVTVGSALMALTVPIVFVANLAVQMWNVLTGKDKRVDIKAAMDAAVGAYKKGLDEIKKVVFDEELPNLADLEAQKETLKAMTDEQLDLYESLLKDLLKLQEDYVDKSTELEEDYTADLKEIDEDYAKETKKLWSDYYEEIAKIKSEAVESATEEQEDYAEALADLNSSTQKSIEDANRKYREAEIKAEKDYQEALRRLKEEFLFDLEDALRARDALQVLRLIRRYNLDKEQLKRQKDGDKKERADAHRSELEEIRRNADDKLRELQDEHRKRLNEIEEQKLKELQEAKVKNLEEIKAAREGWQEKRKERMEQYAQDKEDLKLWLEEELTDIISNWRDMEGVTSDMARSVGAVIQKVFGTGGLADLSFRQFDRIVNNSILNARAKVQEMEGLLASLNSMVSQMVSAQIDLGGGDPTSTTTTGDTSELSWWEKFLRSLKGSGGRQGIPGYIGGFASGVQNRLITKPSLFMAGEVPEVLNVTPVSSGSSGAGNGRGKLELWLSSGLEGRIIESTLNEVDIIFRKELGKKL